MKSNTRRMLAAVFPILVSCLSCLMAHADPKPAHKPFYFGADWSDGDSQAAKDLFYETGCNFVRLDGAGFDYAIGSHQKDLQNFRAHGIYAMLQMGSHWPDWTWDSHTEDFFVDDQGKSGGLDANHIVNYSGQDWPQFSYASPEYRAYLQQTFTKYWTAIGNDPNIVAMQMHNEPGYFWVDGRVFDYNPKAIAAFRLWLPTQYPNISALNTTWGTHFTSFADVDPVKQHPPVSNIASWMDWRRFNVKLIHDFLAWEADLGHRVYPKVPSTTNMSGPLDNWYPLRLGDNFQYTQPFDRAAVDIYASQWTNPFFVGYAMDTTRGAAQGRPITVAECGPYDPKQLTKLTDEQCADRLRSDLWRYIGHGASAISIWTLASAGGSSLTAGEYNPRIRTVREAAHLSKMLDLGDFVNSHSPVALVANTDSFLYYGGLMPNLDGGSRCQESLGGLYAALVKTGVQVDVISTDQVRAGVGNRYRALVMATPAVTDDKLTTSLSSYITRGGLVIAEEPFAEFDRWGKAEEKGNPLQRLFGVDEVSAYNDGAETPISKFGFSGKGQAVLKLNGAVSLASFAGGAPAVTQCRRGHGSAILIASDAGVIDSDTGQAGLSNFLSTILQKDAGIAPRITAATDGYVDTSALHDANGNQLFVVTNAVNQLDSPTIHASIDIAIRDLSVKPGSQLFVIQPETTVNGQTTAGPLLAPMPVARAGVAHVALHNFSSAVELLVAANHDPLLRIVSPSAATPGSSVTIKVTCYNPSPKPIPGALSLVAPSGWKVLGPSQSVRITPRGQIQITLKIIAGPDSGRSVVKARLTWPGSSILSVPVDISVVSPTKPKSTTGANGFGLSVQSYSTQSPLRRRRSFSMKLTSQLTRVPVTTPQQNGHRTEAAGLE